MDRPFVLAQRLVLGEYESTRPFGLRTRRASASNLQQMIQRVRAANLQQMIQRVRADGAKGVVLEAVSWASPHMTRPLRIPGLKSTPIASSTFGKRWKALTSPPRRAPQHTAQGSRRVLRPGPGGDLFHDLVVPSENIPERSRHLRCPALTAASSRKPGRVSRALLLACVDCMRIRSCRRSVWE